jgi:hypothetical protein
MHEKERGSGPHVREKCKTTQSETGHTCERIVRSTHGMENSMKDNHTCEGRNDCCKCNFLKRFTLHV